MDIVRIMIVAFGLGLLLSTTYGSEQIAGTQFINITNPHNGDNVTWRQAVEGYSSATSNSGLKAYLLIWPIEANGPWWVEPTQTYPDGTWESYAYFGRDPRVNPEDIETTYRVEAIMTKEDLNPGATLVELPNVPKSARSESILVQRK
jgi:hypothetical protein